jgi:putative peptidoglycan lipid II flippase
MRTPMWFSLVSLIVNAGGSLAMFPLIGHVGIAAATSLAGWVNAILLGVTLWRRDHFRPSPETIRRTAMILVCSAIMGLALYGAWSYSRETFLASGILVRAGIAASLIAVSMAIYFGLAIATGAVDRSMLQRSMTRRRPAQSSES